MQQLPLDFSDFENDVVDAMFVELFKVISKRIHLAMVEKGFWKSDRGDAEAIALMHSELSEALEYLRNDNPPDDKVTNFSGVEVEFADCIIRMMDTAHKRGWNVAAALIEKVKYNTSREYMHGGKKF